MSALPSDLYSEPLMLFHPRLAHSLLLDRLRQAKTLNEDLADYFRELHAVQDQHIKALVKLSKRFHANSSTSQFRFDQESIQIQSPDSLKTLLHQELLQLIDSHSTLQTQLQSQVESPLRNSLEPSESKPLEEQLNRMVKSYEDSELKLNRSTSKLRASNTNPKKLQLLQAKQSEDQSAFNLSKQLWSNQAPQVFKSYQSIDKKRLQDLFETLIKFETLQNDHYRHQLEISERSTMSLVAFDIQEEMQRFALTTSSISDQPNHTTEPPPSTANHEYTTNQDPHPTSPTIRPTPAPSHPPQSRGHSTPPTNHLTPQSPAAEPSQAQANQLLPQQPQEEQQLNHSPETPPPQSSQIHSSPKTDLASDPNHPEIPKLNAPNISVPIRSTPASPHNPSDSPLPPRTLYVQSQNSLDSTSNQSQNLTHSIDLSRSTRPAASLSKAVSSNSITDKFFSRSRIVHILSRHGNNSPQNNLLKSSQSRRLSQSNLSLDRGPRSEADHPHPGPLSTRRSSSVIETPPANNIYTEEPLKSPTASQTGSKSPWNASRFVPFLPGSNPLRKRKTSQSVQRMASTSVKDLTQNKSNNQYAKTDSEGFTIPPENRDRTPWEQEADTEVLSEAADSSGHQPVGSRNDATTSRESQDSDRQSITGSGLTSFAIKPFPATETQDSEAARLAAIQKVQNTLASSFGSPVRNLSTTRRSNTALRGRRTEGRGVTMYDASPISNLTPSSGLVRRGSVSDRPNTVPIHTADLGSAPLSRSPTDNTLDQTVRSTQSLADLALQNELHGRMSRSDSINSNIFTSSGFHNTGPLLQVGGTPGSKNPFFNASLSSALSNNPSIVSTDPLASSVVEEKSQAAGSPKLMIINEKLNVLMHQGSLVKLLVIGELHVTRLLIDQIGDKVDKLRFKIQHSDRLEKVAFPHGLVEPLSKISKKKESSQNVDHQEYELDLARSKALFLPDQNSFCILKYRLYFDSTQINSSEPPSNMELAHRHLPLIVIPRWRTSKEKTELVLNYKPSPQFQKFQSDLKLSSSNSQEEEEKEQVSKFELNTAIYNSDLDLFNHHKKNIKIQDYQSIPNGRFDYSTNRIVWSIVNNDSQDSPFTKKQEMDKIFNGKIICRFFHHQELNKEEDHDDDDQGYVKENLGPVHLTCSINNLNLTGIHVHIHHSFSSPLINNNSNDGIDLDAGSVNNHPSDFVEKIVHSSTFLAR